MPQKHEVLCRKCFLKNFAKFTGKHLCWGFFLNKPEARKFIKRETPTQGFFCEIRKSFKKTFFYGIPRWLLLMLLTFMFENRSKFI